MTAPVTQPQRRRIRLDAALAFLLVGVIIVLLFQIDSTQKDQGFDRFMAVGKAHYEEGDAGKAIEAWNRAVEIEPAHPDARLNLANAFLLADQSSNAIHHAQQVLRLDPQSAAAHYIIGCAHLRLARNEEALRALQESQNIDVAVTAVNFQLGRAHQALGNWEDALREFQTAVEFEPDHAAAHYALSQVLRRTGRTNEAALAFERYEAAQALGSAVGDAPAAYERCKHTEARMPFQLDPPSDPGIPVTFVDATAEAFGDSPVFSGPAAVIDIHHDGLNDLFVTVPDQGFVLLTNFNGTFQAHGSILPGATNATYERMLVGDLQNNRYEDVIVLGTNASHVFQFATNGGVSEVTAFSGLDNLTARDAIQADFDFTGTLDLLAISSDGTSLRQFRNLGNLYFVDASTNLAMTESSGPLRGIVVNEWNNDDLPDVFVTRESGAPLWLTQNRGAPLAVTNLDLELPAASHVALGDLNNDLHADLVLATTGRIECHFFGSENPVHLPLDQPVHVLALIDYDNDGWLDICAVGSSVRLWRNLGGNRFREVSSEAGLDQLSLPDGFTDSVRLIAADLDGDCDTDLLLASPAGLRLLRNDGGNANQQLKLRLAGNRSNASGLGIRIELTGDRWRTIRTVDSLPVEIGIGPRQRLDSMTVRWFDLALSSVDVTVDSCSPITLTEYILPTGSCPYLYAWDGERFQFITDLLGTAPLGLPLSRYRLIPADTEEYVLIGNDRDFRPRDGRYLLQITEELREVLYLDTASLVVVDRPPGTEVHTTGKLRPGGPFPPHDLVTVHNRVPLKHATNHLGADVTRLLQSVDGDRVSPSALLTPQLRGWAEPHGVTLDFGPLDASRPLVLVMTGWLRFGGGMANIAASQYPDLPFPFPVLEAELPEVGWQPVDVIVGAPAGKTKTIVVDLGGKLPEGARRLRLTQSFEIHWDRIALFEKLDSPETRITRLAPDTADLHWRGFSEFRDLPWTVPLTPDYERVKPSPDWRITPAGWCTRFGDVRELLDQKDNALVLMNGGDELTLAFQESALPPRPEGFDRVFFLYSVGWDKDADFHVRHGTTVEPLPFHGMNDQLYGLEPPPADYDDSWIRKYNTRWVGPLTIRQASR